MQTHTENLFANSASIFLQAPHQVLAKFGNRWQVLAITFAGGTLVA